MNSTSPLKPSPFRIIHPEKRTQSFFILTKNFFSSIKKNFIFFSLELSPSNL